MKLAIMQPYLFPYIGYFQLIASVDKFVFYDDVNWIKNGWINRNRLMISGLVRYITVPLAGVSSFNKICDVKLQPAEIWQRKLCESIRQSYSKAPYFEEVYGLISDVLHTNTTSAAELAKKSVCKTASYLQISTEFVNSSSAYGNETLVGRERVIDICRLEAASSYYNLPGGRSLYENDEFFTHGISLHFIEPELRDYKNASTVFTPGLSIIDILMFNSKREVIEMLGQARVK